MQRRQGIFHVGIDAQVTIRSGSARAAAARSCSAPGSMPRRQRDNSQSKKSSARAASTYSSRYSVSSSLQRRQYIASSVLDRRDSL
eukprot:scaffold12830_cov33-Phaeocystis_antarctica.AAC.2